MSIIVNNTTSTKIKIKLRLLINTSDIKQTINITTVLGQQGINLPKFYLNFEELLNSLKLTYLFPLNLLIIVLIDKTFIIKIFKL